MRGKTRSTKAAIEDAVSRVLDGGESVESVAASSAVHVLTIRKYMAQRKAQNGELDASNSSASAASAGARRGRKPALDPAAELELLQHVQQLHAQGAPVTSEQVLQLANDKMLQVHGEGGGRPSLTLSWLRRFKERHPELPIAYIPQAPVPAPAPQAPQVQVGSAAQSSTQQLQQLQQMQMQQMQQLQQQQMQQPAMAASPYVTPLAPLPTQPDGNPLMGGDSLSKRGRKPILDAQAEQEIMEQLASLERQGQRVTSETILQLARDKVREVNGTATAPNLSMSWLQRFKERHPSLFSERVRIKRGRDEDDLDLSGVSAAPRPVRPRPSPTTTDAAFQSPLSVSAGLSATATTMAPTPAPVATAAAVRPQAVVVQTPTTRTDELLQALLRQNEKMLDMQKRQVELLTQLVAIEKTKQLQQL